MPMFIKFIPIVLQIYNIANSELYAGDTKLYASTEWGHI